MKKRILSILLICALLLALAGCAPMDYKKAQNMMRNGEYNAAAEIFEALGEYKDSAELLMQCRKGAADQLMENGQYVQAAEAYLALGNYGNSAGLYKKARFYQFWQYVLDNGEALDDGSKVLSTTFNSKTVLVNAEEARPGALYLYLHQTKNFSALNVTFTYDLILDVSCDSDNAELTSEHGMVLKIGSSTGTNDSTYQGHFSMSSFTRSSRITLTSYNKVGVDVYGKTTTSNDIDEAPVEDLHTHLYDLLDGVKQILDTTNTGVTFQELGFAAWN